MEEGNRQEPRRGIGQADTGPALLRGACQICMCVPSTLLGPVADSSRLILEDRGPQVGVPDCLERVEDIAGLRADIVGSCLCLAAQ